MASSTIGACAKNSSENESVGATDIRYEKTHLTNSFIQTILFTTQETTALLCEKVFSNDLYLFTRAVSAEELDVVVKLTKHDRFCIFGNSN